MIRPACAANGWQASRAITVKTVADGAFVVHFFIITIPPRENILPLMCQPSPA